MSALPDVSIAGSCRRSTAQDASLCMRRARLEGSTAVIVLGMHRSGTSALAGMLHHLGVDLGDQLMQASPDNPRGYWEHRDIVAVNHKLMAELGSSWDDIGPLPARWENSEAARCAGRDAAAILARDFAEARLWGLKDPRLCRLLPLWITVCDQLELNPRFVLVLRHPGDVASSLAVRDGLSTARAGVLWLRHALEAEQATRGHRRTIIHYEDLAARGGWRGAVSQISRELDLVWPAGGPSVEAAIEAYLAPELRHHHAGDLSSESSAVEQIGSWLGSIYAAFLSNDAVRLHEACDTVSRELDHAGNLFLPIITEATKRLAEARAHLQPREATVAELTPRLSQFEPENAALRNAKALQGTAPLTMTRPPQPPPAAEAFPRWIASRASSALARPDWIAERTRQWPYRPKLALGAIVPLGTERHVALTLRSLLLQVVGDWELHVVAEGAMPAAFASEPRLFWHEADGCSIESLNRFLQESNANWVALIDAGDQLAPHALFSVVDAFFRRPEWSAVYSDEDRIDLEGVRSGPHFKPDFNLDLLRSIPYVGGLLAMRRKLFAQIGGFDARWDGTEEYDLALRLSESVAAEGFGHIADILYHRLTVSGRSKRPIEAICADMPGVVVNRRPELDPLRY